LISRGDHLLRNYTLNILRDFLRCVLQLGDRFLFNKAGLGTASDQMPSEANRFRIRASFCRSLAENVRDCQARAALLELATAHETDAAQFQMEANIRLKR
jgi:hypothetical protein